VKKYPNVQDGDLVIPEMAGYRMACCDCGLVHRLDFEVYQIIKQHADGTFTVKPMPADKAKIGFRASRDGRATGQIRRHRKPKP
jgi:hypothetical protein